MRIVIAPDSFKESLTAPEAAAAIAAGVRDVAPDAGVDLCPMADGGEGTVEALVAATDGQRRTTTVTGPLGAPVEARWGVLGDGETAAIEMAEAAGLHLVPRDRRDPTKTTTRGVGELIRAALDAGCRRLIIGIGGSATTDGGAGMAQALGVRFLDRAGRIIETPLSGGALDEIERIDLADRDGRLAAAEVRVACDVTNPLTGPRGAAAIYGPQKGATPEQVKQLDRNLAHLARLVATEADQPGAGAAGGLGFGLVAFADARLERGVELVLDAVRFDDRLADADLVLTGEGKLDGQSIEGKTCLGVAQRAAGHGVKTIALVGFAAEDATLCLEHGLHGYHGLVNDLGLDAEQAIAQAAEHLQRLAGQVVGRYLPARG